MESNQILAPPTLWEGQEPSQGSQGSGGAASWLSAVELRRLSLSVLPDCVFLLPSSYPQQRGSHWPTLAQSLYP